MADFVPPQPIQTEKDIDSLQAELYGYQQQIQPLKEQLSSQWVAKISTLVTRTKSEDYPSDYYEGKERVCALWDLTDQFGTNDTIQEKIWVLSRALQSVEVNQALSSVSMLEYKIETVQLDIKDIQDAQNKDIQDAHNKQRSESPPPRPPLPSKPKRKFNEIRLANDSIPAANKRKRQKLSVKVPAPISKKNGSNIRININKNVGRVNVMQFKTHLKNALATAPHNEKRAAPTVHETTTNLRSDLLSALGRDDETFHSALFGKSNIKINKVPADNGGDSDEAASIHSDCESDKALMDRDIWKDLNNKSKMSTKSHKWKDSEDDKLCAAIAHALKNDKIFGKPGSSLWWKKVTKKVNNRPYSGNKKRLKEGAGNKKAYRHSEYAKFQTIIKNRRSSSAVTKSMQEMDRYTKMVSDKKNETQKRNDEKERLKKDDNDWREDRKSIAKLLKDKLTQPEQKQNGDKNVEKSDEEKEEPKKYDKVIREIKNKCDDLEDIGEDLFCEEDLDSVRDATFGDTRNDIKEEYLRLKDKYGNDGKTIFKKLIKEAKRMLK